MIGIDEVGRGALAGPLVVAGCYFTENPGFTRGLDDSKKLSKKKREEMDDLVKSNTFSSIVTISARDVDKLGLTRALRQAILSILELMPTDMGIMLDGKYNFLKGTKYESRTKVEVRADSRHTSVMASSIMAKVERDRLMREYAVKYPVYGFEHNVGYGTKYHIDALNIYGPSPIHRKSFNPLKSMLVKK